jgi:hypothetical protein
MRVKYNPDVDYLFNGNSGYTFMRNPVGQSAKTNGKTRHARSAVQLSRMEIFTALARLWRTLSTLEKQNWVDWFEFCPQPTNRDPLISIAPFQNYEKRNFYKYLDEGENFTLMSWPDLVSYEIDQPTFLTKLESGRLLLSSTFARGTGELRCSVFIANSVFNSVNTCRSLDRYFLTIPNETGETDITDIFLEKFGVLPKLNASLVFRCVECGVNNGQFFYPSIQKTIITPGSPSIFHNLYEVVYDRCTHIYVTDYFSAVTAIQYFLHPPRGVCGNPTDAGFGFKFYEFVIGAQAFDEHTLVPATRSGFGFDFINYFSKDFVIWSLSAGKIQSIVPYKGY